MFKNLKYFKNIFLKYIILAFLILYIIYNSKIQTNADLQEIVNLHEKSVSSLGEAKSDVQNIEKELFSHNRMKTKSIDDERSVRILELNVLNDANDQVLI